MLKGAEVRELPPWGIASNERLRPQLPLKRQLGGILDRVFPEYTTLFPKVLGATSSQVLAQAPTPEDLEGMDLAALPRSLSKPAGGIWEHHRLMR